MKKIVATLAVVGAVALASGGEPSLSMSIQQALTTIDMVPTRGQLDAVFAGQALPNLTAIAMDSQGDVGIRLRAIHALAKYCPLATSSCSPTDPGWPAHDTLVAVIAATAPETQGGNLLLLRAAVEAIGPLRVQTDLDTLVPLLDHPSRDIRAATAHALRDLCNSQAINPLRVRYQREMVDQVKLAISETLRILGQAPVCQ